MTLWEDGEIFLAHAKDLKYINLYNWLLNFIHTHPMTNKYMCLLISNHVLRILFVGTFFNGYSSGIVEWWNEDRFLSTVLGVPLGQESCSFKNLCISSWHTAWHVDSVTVLMNGWKNKTEFWESLTCQGSQFKILVWNSKTHLGNGYSLNDNPSSSVVIFSIFLLISKTFMKWEWEHSN